MDQEDLQLQIRRMTPTGSVNVDTSGMGEPIKEVLGKLWTRKERAEARRHTAEMNWRAERDSDQAFQHREQQHMLDTLTKIGELRGSGAIEPDIAEVLIAQLLPIEVAINRELRNSKLTYIDGSYKEQQAG